MVLVSAIAIGFVGYVIYLIFDFKKGLSTTQTVVDKDLADLIDAVKSIELSSWEEEDIDILSRIGDSNLSKKMFGDVETSILYSIYHDPILSIASKRYLNDGSMSCAIKFNNSVYCIKSDSHDESKVLDAELLEFGHINSELLSITSGETSVQIHYQEGTELLPVKFNNVTKLLVNAHDSGDVDQTRAIVKKERINNQERDLFILILSFGLIKQLI